MNDATASCIRFVPSRTEGLLDVLEAAVYHDRLELLTSGDRHVFYFKEICRPQASRFENLVRRLMGELPYLPVVADRDWFHPGKDMYFDWYTSPRIKTYMPVGECKDHYSATYLRVSGN